MKEILFRGKRVDNGEWVEGCLYYFHLEGNLKNKVRCFVLLPDGLIDNENEFEVIPKTVGEWTGVKDTDGDRIFKGDIVVYTDIRNTKYEVIEQCGAFMLVRLDGKMIDYEDLPQNTFLRGSDETEFTGCMNDYCVSFFELMENQQDFEGCLHCRVIGNIHDNPELLEGAAE